MAYVPRVPLSMIKSELVQRIAEHNPHLYQRDVENIVNAILDEIVAALARGEAVVIEDMKEEPELTRIHATIYVDRDSQKGIVIGRSGALLKEIGTRARQDAEKLLGVKVFLQLWVKVKKDWREDDRMLRNIGAEGDDLDHLAQRTRIRRRRHRGRRGEVLQVLQGRLARHEDRTLGECRMRRLLTIMIAPLVPCTARMAVVAFLAPVEKQEQTNRKAKENKMIRSRAGMVAPWQFCS